MPCTTEMTYEMIELKRASGGEDSEHASMYMTKSVWNMLKGLYHRERERSTETEKTTDTRKTSQHVCQIHSGKVKKEVRYVIAERSE